VLFAQNGVAVSGLAVDAGTVTFNVSWDKDNPDMPTLWSDTVWVFVDYNNAGKMERLPLLPGATLTATSPGGKVIEEPDNNKGVWVAGNARTQGSFNATVKLLTATADLAGACAYASNYPPVGEYSRSDATEIVFTGTPKYDVALLHESGSLITQTTDSPLNVPASYTVQSFTDKTAAPGKFACIPSTVYELTASALSFCEGGAGVTFSLSGPEPGRSYRLYKDGTTVVATLTGDGNAATFCEAVNEAGTYTARAAALPEYCPAAMSGTHVVSAVPQPAAPTVTDASRCGTGALTLYATSSNAVIDWYETASGGTALVSGSDSYTTSSLSESITYYAQARNSIIGCLRATRSAVKATVLYNPSSAGNATNACGCANSLLDCNGICLTSCNYLACPGIAEVAFNKKYEYASQPTARIACQQLGSGWRLPTLLEMMCLCRTADSLPATLEDYLYWTSDLGESYAYATVNTSAGACRAGQTIYTGKVAYLCVK
jgi:hypothetical protein